MKKLMSVLLALALVLAMVPVAASAAETTSGLPDAVNGVISLTEDVELSEVAVLTEGTTLKGNGHTISVADDVTWSDANGSQYMLLCSGDGITIEDVTVDAEGVAYGCVQFYASKEGTLTDVTLKNAQELGLLVNASQVTATGTLTLAGNGWGDVINVGWGSGIPAETEKSSFTVAEGAELVGVSSIYSDEKDVDNAGGAGTADGKFEVNAKDFEPAEDGSHNYTRPVADFNGTKYPSLQAAIDAAAASADGDTITLLDNITAEDVEDAGKGTAAFTIPAGVILDGAGHTITASATWTDTNHPILGVTSGAQDVTTKIKNLTIVGNEKSGHGINVWSAEGAAAKTTVAIEGVAIQNCGTAGMVVNNSIVTASGLQTSGSAWGAVNVDKGSAFTLTGTNELAENVQVYSEDAGEEGGDSKITVEGLKMVNSYKKSEDEGLKGFTYYTDDVSKLGEGYNEKTNTVYEDIEDAIAQAQAGDTIVLTKNAEVETPITLDKSITIKGEENVTLTYKANNQSAEGTFITVTGKDVTLRDIIIDTNGKAKHGVQFYETTGGKLDSVTINGGTFTSVLVNGAEVTLTDCTLNPDADAYANIEYAKGDVVTENPVLTIDNVTIKDGTQLVYVDQETIDRLGENPTETIRDSITNKGTSDITVDLPGTEDDIVIEAPETSTPGGTPSEPEEPTWPFTDVTEGDDWFYDAVAYVYENGIMAGTDETTFEPTMELNRAMAAQLFYNLEGKPAVTGDSAFSDVASSHWAVDAITWAAQNDIVAGIGGGLYDPDTDVTREQFAVMLYKYARFKGYDLTATGDLTQFPDAGSISSWAETALSWANGKGLINGHENGTIDPKGSTIRAQAASIMANFDQNVAK